MGDKMRSKFFSVFLAIVLAFALCGQPEAATRAIQIEFLMSGLNDPDTGETLNGGSVEFYSAGTTTPKNVWTEPAKTNAYTSYTLDTNGVIQLYGDGVYKVVVKDSTGEVEYTFDQVKMSAPDFIVRTVTSASVTVTHEDDFIICNTGSNNITLNLEAVATFTRPVTIKKTSANNIATVDPYSSQTIDGSSSETLTANNQTFTLVPDTNAGIWRLSNDTARSLVGLTASVAELNIMDGVTASAAELNQNDGKTLVNTTDNQSIGGAKTFTAGLAVGGGGLSANGGAISTYSSGVSSIVNGIAPGTRMGVYAGPYTTTSDSGGLIAYSKDDASKAGLVELYGTNGTTGVVGLSVGQTGTVNLPVGLQIGGTLFASAGEIGVTIPRQKVVAIGDWNMQTTDHLDVDTGIDTAKIRGVRGVIRRDDAIYVYMLPYDTYGGNGGQFGAHIIYASTYVRLYRAVGGTFDNISWNDTGYNRGWLTIDYVD